MKKSIRKDVVIDGNKCVMNVNLRYDDEYKNGYGIFSITGEIYKPFRIPGEQRTSNIDGKTCWLTAGGCIHNEIQFYFPELSHLIKWHLCNSNEPMYYIANTTYHARTRKKMNKQLGEPLTFDKKLKFETIPFTFKEQRKGFWDYLSEVGDFDNIEVEPVKYDGDDSHNYSDNYSLTGFIKENESKKWYETPFRTKNEAIEFLQALRKFEYSIIEIPTSFNEAVEPNIDAARSCAIWEDATLKQLQDEEALKARLPKLMEEFHKIMEETFKGY